LVLALLALATTLATPTGPASGGPIDDPLRPLFPTADDMAGLVPSGNSHFSDDDLTDLYDGGAARFVKAGVTGASRRYYTLDGASAEIVIHRMTNAKAAEDFLVVLCKDIRAKVESAVKAKACVAASAGTSYGYLAAGPYLSFASFDKEDARTVRALLELCSRRTSARGNLRKTSRQEYRARRSAARLMHGFAVCV
jgi:hypothetical protein